MELTITVTRDHVQQTIDEFITHITDTEIYPAKTMGYCSSCPVGNAVAEQLPEDVAVREILVAGPVVMLNPKSPLDSPLRAEVPTEVEHWISDFDEWFGALETADQLPFPHGLPDQFTLVFKPEWYEE